MNLIRDSLFETFCKFKIADRLAPWFTFTFFGTGADFSPTNAPTGFWKVYLDGIHIGTTNMGYIQVSGLSLGTHVIQLK